MKLTDGTILHGFRVRYSQPIPELKATLYRMEYVKNGADLVWLDRPDENKTFSIAFKTIPSDNTGVFHILEHSVLCGSDKYPVREPFVELLKSSLQTFLNAMTFPDKTIYPVSSRNDADFMNLMDVYMDAVLHPLSRTDPISFRQEGWHYELDSPDGELTRNGVVFNEMKGAYADPNTILAFEMNKRLFPDNCYCFESGGHPDHIPELTYEKYLENHARFYHPSNSYIFLDGEIDLNAVLEKLDGFLAPYEKINVDASIHFQKPVNAGEVSALYEISPDDDGSDKVIVGRGWVYGQYDKPELSFAAAILSSALCGTNESPLKKAILEAGLAQNVSFDTAGGMLQHSLIFNAQNTAAEKKDELLSVLDSVLEEQSRGLDHKQLHAILNQVEFGNREKDFGDMPLGLVFAISALDSWLYGGDPAQGLCNTGIFESLREKIDQGWFEELLRKITLDNPHTATVVLLPSKTLGEEKQARDQADLTMIKAGWSSAQSKQIMNDLAALRLHQSTGDTPEALATLPMLSLSDIPERSPDLPYHIGKQEGVTVLHQDVETGGITYLDLYFDISDLTKAELASLPLLSSLLRNLPTERHTAMELASEIPEKMGRFGVTPAVYERLGGKVVPQMTVSVAVLPERKDDAVALIREVLLTTLFGDSAAVYNILRQSRIGLEQMAMNAGNSFAMMRAGAGLTAAAAVSDAMSGMGQLRFLQAAEKSFASQGQSFVAGLEHLCKRIFTRGRLTVSITGPMDEDFIHNMLAVMPEGSVGAPAEYKPLDRVPEGYSIPAGIGFAGAAAKLQKAGSGYKGSMAVAANVMQLDYLWTNVRVKGGAYGVSMNVSDNGGISFSSYRDPNCANSLEVFAKTGSALRAFAASGEPVDKYVISTIGSTEPYMTPRQEKGRAAMMFFTGRDQEYYQRRRYEILHTVAADLNAFADILDVLAEKSQICVVGGQNVLDACGDKLRKIESVQ